MNEQINILLVEDDPQQQRLIDGILIGSDHRVVSCSSVEEAILA